MSLQQKIAPLVSATITSPTLAGLRESTHEQLRRLRGAARVIDWVHQADDPYSHLLAQMLPRLLASYDVALRFHLVPPPDRAAAPEPEMLTQYGLHDAKRLAQALRLNLPADAAIPSPDRIAAANHHLAHVSADGPDVAAVIAVGRWLWGRAGEPRPELPSADESTVAARLAAGHSWREKHRHYLGATLHYGGVWYWGTDRLAHLVARLDRIGARRAGAAAVALDYSGTIELPRVAPPLEVFFSFRSPYSAIVMDRVFRLAREGGVELTLRPVLPMVMRGLPVPTAKRLYILMDAKREAERLGIPFGRIVDPVGAGAERCLSVTHKLLGTELAQPFISSAMRGIWSEGVDVADDAGLALVSERAGVNAEIVRAALSDDSWRQTMEANRQAMFAAGLWGVPSFRLGEIATWGQDRLWLIERGLAAL